MIEIESHRFYSIEETARLLNVTARSIQRWLRDPASRPEPVKSLDPITVHSRRRIFRAADIHSLVAKIYRIDFDAALADQILHNDD